MKSLSVIALVTVIVMSCGDNKTTKTTDTSKSTDSSKVQSDDATKTANAETLLAGYLSIKNALTADKSDEAADAAKQISNAVESFNRSGLTAEQAKVYDDVVEDIKEHATHISDNRTNIVHQREHFELLSKDITDLIKTTGSQQTLYMDFCPMYNNNKGATWLSEVKEIKNPYLGKKMPTCGEVKEEIKGKG